MKKEPETVAVMFVDQTIGGELAKRLQSAEDRLAAMTGYRVRMSETSGSRLCRLLPNTNPWSGLDCQRKTCYTCNQPGETLEDCKRRNIMYESVCAECNKEETGGKKASKMEEFKTMAGMYVGETGRSIFERAAEHRQDAEGHKLDSHMYKHWKTIHPEMKDPPVFRMKVVASFKDALTRQVSDSVRIDLRGENVLNSKTEYSRCSLPRLTINKEDWKTHRGGKQKG